MDSIPNPVANCSLKKSSVSRSKCVLPCRYSLALMGCFGFVVVYALRVNLSVALVAMVNNTHSSGYTTISRESRKAKEFTWSEETRGVILSSFFYGYLFTQLPGGWLASRFGGKHIYGLGVLFTALVTLLTPWAAGYSITALVVVRVLEGIFEGVTFPAMNVLLSSWSPQEEKGILLTIAYSGTAIGNIIAQLSAGELCASSFLGGWPSVFYIFGGVGILWYFSWLFLVFEKPAQHPRISDQEKQYILSSIGSLQDKLVKQHSVPWLAMSKSMPVYALIVGYFTSNWGFYCLLTDLPTYLKDVMGFDILQDGFISSIPYLVSLVVCMLMAFLGDWLIKNDFNTASDVRKTATIAGLVIPACLLVASGYINKDSKVLAVVLISLSLAPVGNGASQSVNQLDIAPRYAGVLVGIANTFGTVSGMLAPLVTGWLTNGKSSREQWLKVFYVTAGIYVFGAIFFVIFGSGEVQPWNSSDDEHLVEVDVEREAREPLLEGRTHLQHEYSSTSINRV